MNATRDRNKNSICVFNQKSSHVGYIYNWQWVSTSTEGIMHICFKLPTTYIIKTMPKDLIFVNVDLKKR